MKFYVKIVLEVKHFSQKHTVKAPICYQGFSVWFIQNQVFRKLPRKSTLVKQKWGKRKYKKFVTFTYSNVPSEIIDVTNLSAAATGGVL